MAIRVSQAVSVFSSTNRYLTSSPGHVPACWALYRVVLMLIVGLKLKVLPHGKIPGVEFGRTPLAILAFIINFSAGIGYPMIRMNLECAFQRQACCGNAR